MLKLVVGLGNPGVDHQGSRHNLGFEFVQSLADQARVSFKIEKKFSAAVAKLAHPHPIWLLKPITYMNLSGDAVASFVRYYQLAPNEVLIAYDELDLPAGEVRLKVGGGAGGHNGIKDILHKWGEREFVRLRIGIGHPGTGRDVSAYVLGRPGVQERQLMDRSIERALNLWTQLAQGHQALVMNELHRRT
jgi:peptidyl-tRNA hydrolase, PTH1 family